MFVFGYDNIDELAMPRMLLARWGLEDLSLIENDADANAFALHL